MLNIFLVLIIANYFLLTQRRMEIQGTLPIVKIARKMLLNQIPRKESKPIPRALFIIYPFANTIRDLWANPKIAVQLKYGYQETIKRTERDWDHSWIKDVYDGKLWKDVAEPFLKANPYGIVVSLTNDPINIYRYTFPVGLYSLFS
jgi:hypothetical protein